MTPDPPVLSPAVGPSTPPPDADLTPTLPEPTTPAWEEDPQVCTAPEPEPQVCEAPEPEMFDSMPLP